MPSAATDLPSLSRLISAARQLGEADLPINNPTLSLMRLQAALPVLWSAFLDLRDDAVVLTQSHGADVETWVEDREAAEQMIASGFDLAIDKALADLDDAAMIDAAVADHANDLTKEAW